MTETWDEIWLRKGREQTNDFKRLNGYERTAFDVRAVAAAIVKELDMQPGGRLLDVGCGAGSLGEEVLKLLPGTTYVGTERSSTMVQTHIKLLGHSVLNFSAAEPVFSDKFFDYALCFSVFQYFESHNYARETIKQLLRQARDVFVGDLPVESHDNTHQLYTQETAAAWISEMTAKSGATLKITNGLYNPHRFNVIIKQS